MKVYIMVGPPCAGKSTKAREMMRENKNLIRLNRDELRWMFRGKEYKWGDAPIEVLVNHLMSEGANYALMTGKDVISDATHCKAKYIAEAKKAIHPNFDVKYEYIILDIPFWKQRWRNFWRWVKTGVWIPRAVSKTMDTNFREVKQLIENGKL